MDKQKMVYDFHKAFDILIKETPTPPDFVTQRLRFGLIREELEELDIAMAKEDIVEIADGLADLLYVVYGTAVSCGIDMQPIFAEVHRSNMSKVGGHKRQDGKWIKPETYSPANLLPILESQGVVKEERATGVNTKTYNAAAGVWEDRKP